jgi:release factor glutamine methyltransferase
MITIHSLVAAARERLRAAGIPADEADLDARLLAQFVLGWPTERFFIDANLESPPAFAARFESLIARRASREPYAYIVGHQEFWQLDLVVTPAVLIPRPETEVIVEAALARLDAGAPLRIADVGTGSGCLAIALAGERPRATLIATDLSDEALAVARQNAVRHRVDGRIEFRLADLLEGVTGSFDAIVSNPPYVREDDRADIQPEVRFEPAQALFAGSDGLDAIRRLLPSAAARLAPAGMLLFEIGFGQAEAVAALIATTAGLKMSELKDDLQGISRVAIAERA